MYLLINNEKEIIAVVDNAIRNENGILTTINNVDCYYPQELSYLDVEEVPENIKPFTHTYENGSFIKNLNYKAPLKTQNELELEIENLKLMIADLGLMVGGGL